MRKSPKGYLLLGVAVITCPCHLPLLLAGLAGTSLAAVLSEHFVLALLGLSVIFGLSLVLGLKALRGSPQGRM